MKTNSSFIHRLIHFKIHGSPAVKPSTSDAITSVLHRGLRTAVFTALRLPLALARRSVRAKTAVLSSIFLLLLLAIPAHAVTHYVAITSTNPVSPFITWETAATNIQDAIDVSISNDTVLVSNGVYATGGRLVAGVSGTNRIAVTNAITVQSFDGPAVTTIKGQGPSGSSAVRCVYMVDGATLVGFTLTNGFTAAAQPGGGIYASSVAAKVFNCLIVGNTAGGNAAACKAGGSFRATLYSCSLIGNSVGGFLARGGGAAESILYDCAVVGNALPDGANYGGGGVADSILYGCTIIGNSVNVSSISRAGGAYNSMLQNCIVYYNTPSNHSGCTFANCCTTPMPASGAGNFTNAPMTWSANSPHLMTGSPCIDAGDDAQCYTATDVDGDFRTNGISVDVGCDEFWPGLATGALSVAISTPSGISATTGIVLAFSAQIEGIPTGLQWDFGDGSVVVDQGNVAHSYGEGGIYVVTLIVSNLSGTAMATATVRIEPVVFIWNSTNSPLWDLVTTNWRVPGNHLEVTKFANSNLVRLDDSMPNVQTSIFIATNTIVVNGITVNSSSNDYVIEGRIGGTGGMFKTGSGTLTLFGTNTYTGGTIVQSGTLVCAAGGTSAGAIRGALTVLPGASVVSAVRDSLGWTTGAQVSPIAIDHGTLVHSATNDLSFRQVQLNLKGGLVTATNKATINTPFTGLWFFNSVTVNTAASESPSALSGVRLTISQSNSVFTVEDGSSEDDLLISAPMTELPFTDFSSGARLIKNGSGTMSITSSNGCKGAVVINEGRLSVNLIADAGDSRIGSVGGSINNLIMNGGALRFTGAASNSTTRFLYITNAPVVFDVTQTNGSLTLAPSGGTVSRSITKAGFGQLTMNSLISGPASVVVSNGILKLGAANTYTGPTTISDGVLDIALSASISNSPVITIMTGGVLKVYSHLALGPSQMLAGVGTVLGNVVGSGAVKPGIADSGSLLIHGEYYPGSASSLFIALGASNHCTSLKGTNKVFLTGSLTCSWAGGYQPTGSEEYVIAEGVPVYDAFVATNLPTLAFGLGWSLTNLYGAELVLSVTGFALHGYDVWASAITNGLTNYTDSATGDGYPNLLKYATGSSPTNSDELARMDGVWTNDVFALRFNRNTNANDVTLVVEGSTAATNDALWSGIATNSVGSWGEATNVIETGTGTPVSVTVQDATPQSGAATNRFLRLRVTRP